MGPVRCTRRSTAQISAYQRSTYVIDDYVNMLLESLRRPRRLLLIHADEPLVIGALQVVKITPSHATERLGPMTTDFAKINALGNWKRLVSMFERKYAIGISRAFNDVIQETARWP